MYGQDDGDRRVADGEGAIHVAVLGSSQLRDWRSLCGRCEDGRRPDCGTRSG
jgi:hypothetical protein